MSEIQSSYSPNYESVDIREVEVDEYAEDKCFINILFDNFKTDNFNSRLYYVCHLLDSLEFLSLQTIENQFIDNIINILESFEDSDEVLEEYSIKLSEIGLLFKNSDKLIKSVLRGFKVIASKLDFNKIAPIAHALSSLIAQLDKIIIEDLVIDYLQELLKGDPKIVSFGIGLFNSISESLELPSISKSFIQSLSDYSQSEHLEIKKTVIETLKNIQVNCELTKYNNSTTSSSIKSLMSIYSQFINDSSESIRLSVYDASTEFFKKIPYSPQHSLTLNRIDVIKDLVMRLENEISWRVILVCLKKFIEWSTQFNEVFESGFIYTLIDYNIRFLTFPEPEVRTESVISLSKISLLISDDKVISKIIYHLNKLFECEGSHYVKIELGRAAVMLIQKASLFFN